MPHAVDTAHAHRTTSEYSAFLDLTWQQRFAPLKTPSSALEIDRVAATVSKTGAVLVGPGRP